MLISYRSRSNRTKFCSRPNMDYSQLDDNPWISDEENMRILALVPQTAPESIYTRRVAAFYLSMNHTARMLLVAFRERLHPLLQLNTRAYKLLRNMFTLPFFSVNSSMFRTWEALPRILSRLQKWILHLTIALTLGLSIAQASNHQDSNGKPFFSQPYVQRSYIASVILILSIGSLLYG